jgi:carboxylate-amine ligase
LHIQFKNNVAMSLGVELELQLLHGKTKDLVPLAPEVLRRLPAGYDRIKPEIFRSMIEVNTNICPTIADVKDDLMQSMELLYQVCDDLNIQLASTGSHPFAKYHQRIIYPNARYEKLIDRNRWIAERLMIFGIHVHIGMRNGEHAMQMTNGLIHYLPCLLAISASSPFWQGRDTGLASSRITIFEAMPTAGHPCTFESWGDFEHTVAAMTKSNTLTSMKDLWWDIRPSPDFGTIEIRVCDGMPTLTETLNLVALIQTLAYHIDAQLRSGKSIPPPPDWILRENKWRAARWGLDANLIVNNQGDCIAMRDFLQSTIEMIAPTAQLLGCSAELNCLRLDLNELPSYARQREIYNRAKSTRAVADSLAQELRQDFEQLAAHRRNAQRVDEAT